MSGRTARSRVTWGIALLDWALAGTVLSTVGVAFDLLQGDGVAALRPIPYAVVGCGSFVLAAHRLGARLPDYFRSRLRAPL